MGIYDRPYYSDDSEQAWTGGPLWNQRMVVTNLVLLNVFFFVLNFLFGGRESVITSAMAVRGTDLVQPWYWWHFFSYAFAHNSESIWHIAFNMFSLWMLGRPVELHYGRNEFLRIYLLAAVIGGIIFATRAFFTESTSESVGASGAVICITMLFVFLNPRATLMMYGVFPMPAWLLGALIVLLNFLGTDQQIAYDVHLAGIGFAALYFYSGTHFGRWIESIHLPRWKRHLTGPRLKLHDPEKANREAEEADRILQKIFEQGQDSLTAKEKRFMEKYSLKKRKERDSNPS